MEEQKRLFEIVKSKIPKKMNLPDVMEDLLGLAPDTVYRRIRGESELRFSEIRKICEEYDLAIDEILSGKPEKNKKDIFIINDAENTYNQKNCINLFRRLSEKLESIKSSEDAELILTAQYIPLFHLLKYPELTFFTLYTWYDASRSSVSYHDFCNCLDRDQIESINRKIYDAFLSIPSKEIWNNKTVDVLLSLLNYYFETGVFEDKDTVFRLLEQFDELLSTVEGYATDGHKNDKNKTHFSLYSCSVDIENNSIMLKGNNNLSCYFRLHTMNIIETANELLCSSSLKWADSLISKSILVSNGGSRKEKYQLFLSARTGVSNLIRKIKLC